MSYHRSYDAQTSYGAARAETFPYHRPHQRTQHGVAGGSSRQELGVQSYACVGCDAVFDRASALKQHAFVHTGEKPFSCDVCGRRFAVQSNLRRHGNSTCRTALVAPDQTAPRAKPVRHSSAHPSEKQSAKKGTGRPRSTTWVPASLLGFKNAPSLSSTGPFNNSAPLTTVTVPLPPIAPNIEIPKNEDGIQTPVSGDRPLKWEERNSFDSECPVRPYHPSQWTNRLPGPGLMAEDELVKTSTVARRYLMQP